MSDGLKALSSRVVPRSPKDYGRVGAVIALLIGVLVVTSATAYTSTRLLSGDQSAWLQKGHTIAEINGPSARYEATAANQPMAAGSPSDSLQIVQQANGQVYTVDPATKKTFQLDPSTMTLQPGPAGNQILAAGSHTFVLNDSAHTLLPVDPSDLAQGGKPIKLPGPVASAAITPDGTVYLGGTAGQVYEVANDKVTTTKLTGAPDSVNVTVLGTQPVAVIGDTDGLYNLTGGQPAPLHLPGDTAAPLEVANSQPAGPLWLVHGNLLIGVDLDTGQIQQTTLQAGDDYGAPVTNAGRVYVADMTAGKVFVFDEATLQPVAPVPVPAGAPGPSTIQLVVKDGAVWLDNPTSEDGKLITSTGQVTTIDKGTGDGVVNPTTSPTSTNPPSASPGSSTTPSTGPAPSTGSFAQAPVAVPSPSATAQAPIQVPSVPVQAPTAPVAPPSFSPTSPTPPVDTTTMLPHTSTTAGAAQATVPDVAGQQTQQACSTLSGVHLACNPTISYNQTAGQPGVVVSTTPGAGSKAATGASVTLTEDEVAVPSESSSTESYQSYCPTVDSAGLTCDAVDGGQSSSSGTAAGTIKSIDPSQGSLEEPGTKVTVEYYSSAAPASETVPSCAGETQTACSATLGAAHLTLNPGSGDVGQAIACNTAYTQSPAAGATETEGQAVSVTFESVCSHPLYEYQYIGENGKYPYVHYLSFSTTPPGTPSNWSPSSGTSAGANAYEPVNGACTGAGAKTGTTPLYEFTYKDSTGFDHYYFNDVAPYTGWTEVGVIACVFPRIGGPPAGGSTTPIYDNSLGNPNNVPTGDDDWTPGSGQRLAWYQPTV